MFSKLWQDIQDARRFRKIISVFVEEGLGHLFDDITAKLHIRLRSKLVAKLREKEFESQSNKDLAKRVCRAFERLGPTFIKFGQLLSVRPDILPPEFIMALERLQDNVTQMSFRDVKRQIRSEFKKPMYKIFKTFDKKPIGSASLAQAHRAVLKSGKVVLVKVQRRNIEKRIKSDLRIINFIAKLLNDSEKYRYLNLPKVAEEFLEWTLKELDFEQEASFAERFARDFKDNKDIVVPKVYRVYTTKKVLTYEFINGYPLNKLLRGHKPPFKVDRLKIARLGLDSIVKQVIIDGFFHADPHPGNILVLKGNKMAYLDFGMMGSLSKRLQKRFMLFLFYITEKDVDKVIETVMSAGASEGYGDLYVLKQELETILRDWYGKKLKDESIAQVFFKLIRKCSEHKIILPSKLTMLGKAFFTYDGIARDLVPDIVVDKELIPSVKKYVSQRISVVSKIRDVFAHPERYLLLLEEIPEFVDAIENIKSDNAYTNTSKQDQEKINDTFLHTRQLRSLKVMCSGAVLSGGILLVNTKTSLLGISQNYAILAATGVFALFSLISIFSLKQ